MIPKFPEFKLLTIDDHQGLKPLMQAYPRTICELSLANLHLWQDYDHPRVTRINDNICILISPEGGKPFFYEPLGRHKLNETIETCLRQTGLLSRVSASILELLPKERYVIFHLRDQDDYIYLVQELAAMKGKKYDGKRNHIKRFLKAHPSPVYRQLRPEDEAAAGQLFEKWFAARKETRYFQKLAYPAQKNALARAFSGFSRLHLFGGALFLDQELVGFNLGSELSREMVAVHFMYTDPHRHGLTQYLLQTACKETYNNYKYINLEQDLGIPGLRTAKLSYHPYKI
ncbi:hypothetical protein A2311_04455 [candidate division WOR-1 bacterium RIFOXYB2_FULL_48_7]|uniref:Phosphatidylglycerol lysyltransferase C-terminal domain-containing protein n=1 Tax=candidate division WOR-1 bacterium RIFOXYB2_FULL_48_7 TaxID=1802583 RepID=A0A1F4TIY5_UNCSA|nr:MAG: hypothetical protein A2311_04455 [candidate division WOR-1 bacterium RIFOXYB2_FULL_48_7]